MKPINPSIVESAQMLGRQFASARPFRHLNIEGFFTSEFADALLQEFPPFERGNALNENGQLGGKSTIEQIKQLGPVYAELDRLIQSQDFLDWLSTATGIPDLLYDTYYFGGGTHENRHGQELDVHVDFNRHPANGWHRRLNLIVYLNPEWDEAWGGSLELHSDPRSEQDEVTLIAPRFNRCVIFETTENSWHGFNRIVLPEDRQHLSRKSVALYFYTRARPAEEVAPTHSTIYVDRPLPSHYVPGHTLSEADVHELRVLLARRDQHLQRLYSELSATSPATSASEPGLMGALASAAGGFGRYAMKRREPGSRNQLKQALRPLARQLPAWIREPARAWWRAGSQKQANADTTDTNRHLRLIRGIAGGAVTAHPPANSSPENDDHMSVDYARKLDEESKRFSKEVNVNDLPPIFHYWSNKYLRPALESFGVSNPDEFFAQAIRQAVDRLGQVEVLSIGCGNCDTEVRVAGLLRSQGVSSWRFTCLDLVPEMLDRGKAEAAQAGMATQFDFVCQDFNRWRGGERRYDVIIANQCLHHVLELESLFINIRTLLAPQGRFVTSDMIGRNGHQRWPEALAMVREFWKELPESYRYNLQLERQEDQFMDWDCSVEGFEGIRSQDILPLLIEHFHFETFIAFGNVIDPFIDRSFGWHFDAQSERDRDFIDRVHAVDVEAIRSGRITPTHLMAVMSMEPPAQSRRWDGLDPLRCVRRAQHDAVEECR